MSSAAKKNIYKTTSTNNSPHYEGFLLSKLMRLKMKHPLWWRECKCEYVALANALKNLKRVIADKLPKGQKHEINQFICDHLEDLTNLLINGASIEYVNLSKFEKVKLDYPFCRLVDVYFRHTSKGGFTGDEWAGDIAFVIDNRVWMFHFCS